MNVNMAAPMRRLARRMFDGAINNFSISSPFQRPLLEGGHHTTSASVNAPKRRLQYAPYRWNLLAQQRRTLFGLFKRWRPAQPEPVAEEALPYRIVMPGNVSAARTVPDTVPKPEYASSGVPSAIYRLPILLGEDEMDNMRQAGAMARKILDIGAAHVKPGVTTDFIDGVMHAACVENNVYPSTLNYKGYPKSVCTSVNNVMVHGIPDDRPLQDGDIINIDFTVFMNGYHGDVSETYTVGSVDDAGRQLIEVARRCRDEAIKVCQPYQLIAHIGMAIQSVAAAEGYFVSPSFVGHGIGKQFHCKPDIWHYANDYSEKIQPGMAFTIEPVVMETRDSYVMAGDGWTVLAGKHTRSAQFEHTVLVTREGVEVLTASPDEHFEMPAKLEEESPPLTDDEDGPPTGTEKDSKHDDWKF